MDLELELRETYAEQLAGLDISGGDVVAARRAGARLRAKRRLAVGTAAAIVAAVAAAGSLVGTGRVSIGPSQHTGHWRELPAAPLSPRANAQAVWTGQEVVVVGGEEQPCPPGADCAASDDGLRDVAAYNPDTDSWRRIESAPVPVVPGDRLLAAGDFVVLRHAQRSGGSAWFVLDPERNHWLRLRDVPKGIGDLPSVFGSVIYALAGRHVVSYDVSRATWSTLPVDPITPRLGQRRVTATPYGPVLTGVDSTQPQDGSAPSLLLADVWDGNQWRRLPPSDQLANNQFSWTGTRMVDPEPFTLDGGDVNGWGRSFAMGGTLDPASGTWGPLPERLVSPPEGDARGWGISASAGRWIAAFGQVYDDSTGDLWHLPQPDGAPDYGVAAAWAGDRLLTVGGTTFGAAGSSGDVTNRAWLWTP